MKRASRTPSEKEKILGAAKLDAVAARHLVASYYAAQEMRKRLDMQLRHMGTKGGIRIRKDEDAEVTEADKALLPPILSHASDQFVLIESTMEAALGHFARSSKIGLWCLAQHGIRNVLTAGMLAHFDITRAASPSHFWSFAGLAAHAIKWKSGEKRPYNAELKQLMFHLGECFKRTNNDADSYYGAIYRERKAMLVLRNERGDNAERAKTFYTKSAEVRKILKLGKLPAGNLDRQACNYAAKIFVAQLYAIMQFEKYHTVTAPYAIEHLGHVDLLKVPHAEMFPGFEEAYREAGRRRRQDEPKIRENTVVEERAGR